MSLSLRDKTTTTRIERRKKLAGSAARERDSTSGVDPWEFILSLSKRLPSMFFFFYMSEMERQSGFKLMATGAKVEIIIKQKKNKKKKKGFTHLAAYIVQMSTCATGVGSKGTHD